MCGCTDVAACSVAGVPCFWVANDLCSACATVEQVVESPGGKDWLSVIVAFIEGDEWDLDGRVSIPEGEGNADA
jgi:hypothetical protein